MSYANMDGVPTQTAGTSELLASDWNTYVRDNFDSIKFGHIVCTSSTRPTGIAEGTMIYETDTNKVLVYSGSAWIELHDLDSGAALPTSVSDLSNLTGSGTAFTPSWNNLGGTFAYNTGRYWLSGKTIRIQTHTRFGASTTYSGQVQLIVPVGYITSANWIGNGYPNPYMPVGQAVFHDASTGNKYDLYCNYVINDGTTINFNYRSIGTNDGIGRTLTNTSIVTFANQDSISVNVTYNID